MATRMIPYAQAIECIMRSSSGVEYGVVAEGEGRAGISVSPPKSVQDCSASSDAILHRLGSSVLPRERWLLKWETPLKTSGKLNSGEMSSNDWAYFDVMGSNLSNCNVPPAWRITRLALSGELTREKTCSTHWSQLREYPSRS
jgi:hypothetical protein